MKLSNIIKLLEKVKEDLGDLDYDDFYDVGICTNDAKHYIAFNTFNNRVMDKESVIADGCKWQFDDQNNIVQIY